MEHAPTRQPVRRLADASPYHTEMLSLVPNRDALRSHRSTARGDLIVPCTFTRTSSPYGFAVSGHTERNSLLKNLENKERRWRRVEQDEDMNDEDQSQVPFCHLVGEQHLQGDDMQTMPH